MVQLQLQLSYAQKRFCCGLKGLKAPLFALGPGPPRGARAISCFLFCFTAFQFVAVCCTIDSFDSESTALLGAGYGPPCARARGSPRARASLGLSGPR